MNQLPEGWEITTLGELGVWLGGGTPSKSKACYWGGQIPWVSPKDMKNDLIVDAEDHITLEAVENSATQIVPKKSILIVTRSGILRRLLPVAVTACDVAINQDIKVLTPYSELESEFIARQLRALSKDILSRCTKSGTTVDSVDFNKLKAYPLVLAPRQEQRRIVAKLDRLFERTRRAREELSHIPLLIENYKKAILAAAFRGDLTKDWRSSRNPKSVIWETKSISQILIRIKAGKNLKCEERPPEDHEKGVLKVSAVTWGDFDSTQSKTFPNSFLPSEETLVKRGDFLFSRANTIELVGACVIVKEAPANLYLSDKILRLELEKEEYKPWLLWFLRSPQGRRTLEASSTGNQLSMRNISQGTLRNIEIPMPTEEERAEIISKIEKAMTWLDVVASEQSHAAHLLDHLDQAHLAKAFRGELVPQDPNDEPAAALLARIRSGGQ